MGQFIDRTEQKYGRLTAICRGENTKDNHVQWWVQCDCYGDHSYFLLRGSSWGITQSCGCVQKEWATIAGSRKKLYNEYDLKTYDYGVGYTSDGETFLFDKEDYDLIKDYCWCVNSAQDHIVARNEDGKIIKLSRIVMQVDDPKIKVDHIKHNRHDNRKSQLRVGSNQQNGMNHKIAVTNTSGVTGVYYRKDRNKWVARIEYKGKVYHLGSFDTKEEAVAARKAAEEKYYGEWSFDNSMNN